MNYILDTCVISELIKPEPQPSVCTWIENQDNNAMFLSVITLGEIQKGVSRLDDGAKKTQLQSWLDKDLALRFENRILDINEPMMKLWGNILAMSEKTGHKLPVIDTMIASTAIFHHMAVVTRNIKDMAMDGLTVINPWEPC